MSAMISVEDGLPEWYENVLVFGVARKLNICPQFWEARRWTGWTNGYMKDGVDMRGVGEWLCPCDYVVRNVTHWMPLPSRDDILNQ